MPWFVQFAPFIPFFAMIPPSLAAIWDIQERLDFTERLLSQVRESHRELPKGS